MVERRRRTGPPWRKHTRPAGVHGQARRAGDGAAGTREGQRAAVDRGGAGVSVGGGQGQRSAASRGQRVGRRPGDAHYEDSELDALELLCAYVALAVQNHALTQTIAQRVSENLRLMASLHGFYDNALEAFATAIDVKHVNIHGHSLRVARYAAAIGEGLGMDQNEVAALRSAGYLHDIGKVAVDKYLFGKPTALDPEEFRVALDDGIDKFADLMRPLGLVEISRTGVLSIQRGVEAL